MKTKSKAKLISFLLLSFALSIILLQPLFAYASSVIPRLNLGRKWYNTPTDIYFSCDFDTAERNAVNAAMNKWNSVKDPNDNSIISMYLTTSFTPNIVQYGILADGLVGYCEIRPITGEEINAVTIILNDSYNWSTTGDTNAYDIQSVVMHELGHAVGIAHCHEASEGEGPCWSSTCLDNVMNPRITLGKPKHTFQEYDTASYLMIYYY